MMLAAIEKELAKFLEAHLDANKMTAAEHKLKAGLNRRLLESKQKLKEE